MKFKLIIYQKDISITIKKHVCIDAICGRYNKWNKIQKMIKAKFIMNDEKSLPYISKK